MEAAIREDARARRESVKTYLFDHVDEDLARKVEKVRLGEEESLEEAVAEDDRNL